MMMIVHLPADQRCERPIRLMTGIQYVDEKGVARPLIDFETMFDVHIDFSKFLFRLIYLKKGYWGSCGR